MATKKKSKFAVFILSHGRPNNVITYQTLRKSGYTGNIYIVCDNEDETINEYIANYGDQVIIFDRTAMLDTPYAADSKQDCKALVFARNQNYQIAQELGLDYFWQLDDDYTSFCYRLPVNGQLISPQIKSLDAVLEAMIQFVKDTGAITFAMSQGGDHLGGVEGDISSKLLTRKAMNSFILQTSNPFTFIGRINEDVNAYVTEGSRGQLIFTTLLLSIHQKQTQKQAGGLTDLYKESGTYMKSMYTVMMHPSSVVVRPMGNKYRRLHHHIDWNATVPKIINQKHQKKWGHYLPKNKNNPNKKNGWVGVSPTNPTTSSPNTSQLP